MRDLYHDIAVVQATDPAVSTANITSAAIDLQGFNSAMVLFAIGLAGDTLSGSVYWTLKLTECDTDNGTFTDVASSDIHGSQSIVVDSMSKDQLTYKIGYVGNKRYLKAVATKTGTHTNGTPIGITALKGGAANKPVN